MSFIQYTNNTVASERRREAAMFEEFVARHTTNYTEEASMKHNPETILMRNDEVTVEKLARQHDARNALTEHYTRKAAAVGLSLDTYCKRFNVKL